MATIPPKKSLPPFMRNQGNQSNEKPDAQMEARKGAAAKRLAELKAKRKGK